LTKNLAKAHEDLLDKDLDEELGEGTRRLA
jgi:hypothetical protein